MSRDTAHRPTTVEADPLSPVLVVRPFWTSDEAAGEDAEHRPIRTLLVPVDGSDLSAMVIPAALEFAGL